MMVSFEYKLLFNGNEACMSLCSFRCLSGKLMQVSSVFPGFVFVKTIEIIQGLILKELFVLAWNSALNFKMRRII